MNKTELLAVCPYYKCQKIIFRRGKVFFEANSPNIISFHTICPHCQNKVFIKMGLKIETKPYDKEI